MRFVIDNDITVYEPTQKFYDWCKTELVLDNPDYINKKRLNKWLGSTPEKLYLFEVRGDKIHVPFGCLKQIWKEYRGNCAFEAKFATIQPFSYDSGIVLYDYQKAALNAVLRAKNGILVMPCGSGKTQTGLEIIARIGGRALWLTHTQDLLNQSKTRAETVFGCDKSSFGTITAGKVNIGKSITFATVQTMAKIDVARYKNDFDVIICDECQHAAGSPTRLTQFYYVISKLSARYKIGLTATPKRSDGLERSMFALLGDLIYEVTKEDVKKNTCKVFVKQIQTGYFPASGAIFMGDGTLDYNALTNDLIADPERKNLILEELNRINGSCLVLANRISYLEDLKAGYNKKSICLSTLGTSKKAKQERKEALNKLNNGEVDAVFATYQLAKEGLDVPTLKYVVFATPEKDETTIIQSVGRVSRNAEGKECGTVIDFVDSFGMYQGWSKKRRKHYLKINATIFG